jgi:transcriptional regulator with XRE-family HTH domain
VTGAAIKALREASSIRQMEIAKELSITPQAVAAAERSKQLRPANQLAYIEAMGRIVQRKTQDRRTTALVELGLA